ncbi:Gfo/Idh/MocA family oxidoreductase [Dyadobacter sp. CY107]|uniref:Gfo/Idh/MocA family protein n=1 Tax=Dyadobacter fanqingshengii TaxID=2906443 RepID=UPI001F1DD37F|nr:Gfo/Idh/MocA family oxidoreductase [Dyadobacter fanqingshengii]MCF2505747.1 Gfo/Idh/MocA family oxidoreductase [Dyadobacter fanqingshengii]
MRIYKFAVLGTGFWSGYQLAGWNELKNVKPIAFYNRSLDKAKALALKHDVEFVYDNVDELLDQHAAELDFVDIITDVNTHAIFTKKAAARGLTVICQKPMSPSWETSLAMVETCKAANVQFYIHENFRFQAPVRKLKEILEYGVIGKMFKANVAFCSGFPVFDNQPFLKDLEQFIITDIGSHVLDISRFLFGEAESLYCHTARINLDIRGEDVANVLLRMKNGISCFVEMSYATIAEQESFPQTLITVEGEKGTIQLLHNYMIKITTRKGTVITTADPKPYPWMDPEYAVVHSSIVDCNRNILDSIMGKKHAETTGKDNLETMRLVQAAYQSARENKVIHF